MPWVQRHHQRYYYQTTKSPENHYRMQYVGVAGSPRAARAAQADQDKHAQTALRRHTHATLAGLLDEVEALRALHVVLVRAALLLSGCYLRRSEVRTITRKEEV
jgi:hypothetical protein